MVNKKITSKEVHKILQDAPEIKKVAESNMGDITIDKTNKPTAMEKLLAKVEELERKDVENEKKLKMLYDVADKGRVFNYENSKVEKKPFKIQLSKFADGLIVGWRTIKDELIKNPTTGLTVGENQEYELKVLTNTGEEKLVRVASYPAFSNARYSERIECLVLGRSEDYEGRMSYTVILPDNRQITLGAQFVN